MRDGFIGVAWVILLIIVALTVTAGDVGGALTAPAPTVRAASAAAAAPATAAPPSQPTLAPTPTPSTTVKATASAETPVSAAATPAPPTPEPSPSPTPPPTPVPPPQVTVETVVEDDLAYYVADIRLYAPEQLMCAFAGGKYSKNAREHLSDMAAHNAALFAINADYCAFRSDGIVIRDGELYRNIPSGKDLLCVMPDGTLEIRSEREQDGQALLDEGVRSTFSFGPALVRDGQAAPMPSKYFISTRTKEPRTAIGQIDALHYVAIVVDGRAPGWSEGITLDGLAQLFLKYGCVTAYNLDGGGSATMFFNGQVVNRVSGGGQRSVSDMIYVPLNWAQP